MKASPLLVRLAIAGWCAILFSCATSGAPRPGTLPAVRQPRGSVQVRLGRHRIGTRHPYWIWQVLPQVFADKLPRPGGYAAFGLYGIDLLPAQKKALVEFLKTL